MFHPRVSCTKKETRLARRISRSCNRTATGHVLARRRNFLQKFNGLPFDPFHTPTRFVRLDGPSALIYQPGIQQTRSRRLWPKSNLNREEREVLFCAPSVVPLGSAHNGDDVNNSEWTSESTSNFGREPLQYEVGMVKYSRSSFSILSSARYFGFLAFQMYFPSFLWVKYTLFYMGNNLLYNTVD